jgi:hypothetical protein
MLTKSVLSLGALALVSAAMLWAQGPMGHQQGFTDCDLDIRPTNRPEVQVYWTEAPDAQIGGQFHLWINSSNAITSNLVKIGLPDGTHEIYLKSGVENLVTFIYNEVTKKVTIELCNVTPNPGGTPPVTCPTEGPYEIPLIGSYLGTLGLEPPTEVVGRKPNNDAERLLITGRNFGIDFSFTMTRYYR